MPSVAPSSRILPLPRLPKGVSGDPIEPPRDVPCEGSSAPTPKKVTLSGLRRGAGPADQLRAATSERQVRLAREVLEAAENLGRVRGLLTRRALTHLVGPLHVGMARDLPAGDFAGEAVRASLWFKPTRSW